MASSLRRPTVDLRTASAAIARSVSRLSARPRAKSTVVSRLDIRAQTAKRLTHQPKIDAYGSTLRPGDVRHLVSVPQVMFDETHPHVEIPQPQGPTLYRNIRASYPQNAGKLVAELNALFKHSATPPPQPSRDTPWTLEASCDAISRVYRLPSKAHVSGAVAALLREADALNHHPAVTASGGGGAPWQLYVTCTTHRPAGLSVKDARLARKIDAVACVPEAGADATHEADTAEEVSGLSDARPLHDLRLWHWRNNIGRATPQLDGAEEGDGAEAEAEESSSPRRAVRGRLFWPLNTTDDLKTFIEAEEEVAESDVPTMRGLMP